MRKNVILVLTGIMMLCIGFALYQYNKPSSKVAEGEPVYSISAGELFTAFETNETEGNRKFLNQVILVTGQISDVTATDSLGVNISLDAGNGLFGVTCEIEDTANIQKLRPGQHVSIKGLCTGKLMDVVLVKCQVQPTQIVTN